MRNRLIRSLSVFAVALSCARPVHADVFVGPVIDERVPPAKDDATQGVFVRDSGVVTEKLALAERMERLGAWDKSADVYQEILMKFADRVVPVESNNDKQQYTSVATAVQARLAKWPQAGIQTYNARFDSIAAGFLKDAPPDDASALQQVFSQYFATDTGRAAGLRLIDLHLEAGDFFAAAWTGEQLLRFHPSLAPGRPKVLYRTALAFHLAGNDSRARVYAGELEKQFPNDTGTLHGSDVLLSQSIAEQLKVPAPRAQAAADDSWPMFGGSPQRNRVPVSNASPGARMLPTIELDPPDMRSAYGQPNPHELQMLLDRDRVAGLTLGIQPVLDKGQVFFQDGRRIYAISAESRMELSGWRTKYTFNQPGTPRGMQFCITLTDDSVLAIVGQTDRVNIPMLLRPQRTTQLVCLDRQSGKARWTGPKNVPDSAALRSAELTGSPLVVGDFVYVVLRNSKGAQFEDSYVMCMERATGTYRWATYIASANGRIVEDMVGGMLTDSHLASLGGRLFICSDIGAAASLDAESGRIIWLNVYPREGAVDPNLPPFNRRMPRGGGDPTLANRPWNFNPVIISDGKLFVLPVDGKFLHIYDAATGEEIKRLDLSKLDNADTLLAVIGDKLVVAGDYAVLCINWALYDGNKFDRRSDPSIVWPQKLAAERIRGRGFVTTTAVYLTTEKHLYRIDLHNGKVISTYPSDDRTWEEGEGPGNVLVSGDQIYVAGDRRISVYSEMNLAVAHLDAEVAKSPKDPDIRLRYAEVIFGAGKTELLLPKIDEALALIEADPAYKSGPPRERAFNHCMSFAARFSKDANSPSPGAIAVGLYERAAKLAANASEQVNWRIDRAKLAAAQDDLPLAVKLYQEILSDKSMRSATVADSAGVAAPAAQVAAKSIDRLIRIGGQQIYAAFDQQAADALSAARAAADPARLMDVAMRFPNSSRNAPLALIQAADVYEALGDSRQAIKVLRQLYASYPKTPNPASVLEGMARNYLNLPGRSGAAIARLAQAARMFNDPRLSRPLRLPDGNLLKDISFSAAVAELRRQALRESVASIPDMKLSRPPPGNKQSRRPLVEVADAVIPNVATVLAPIDGFSRSDRIVLQMTSGHVQIHDVGQPAPKMSIESLGEPPAGTAWSGGGLLVWTGNIVTFLQPDSAAAAWKWDLKSVPGIDVIPANDADTVADTRNPAELQQQIIVNRQRRIIIQRGIGVRGIQIVPQAPQQVLPPGTEERITAVRPLSDRVLVATSFGRVVCLDLTESKLIWQTRLTDKSVDRIVVTDDFTAIKAGDDGTAMIGVIDNFSGQPVGRWTFTSTAGMLPTNLALSVDGTLVYTLPDKLFIKDLYEQWTKEPIRVDSDANEAPLNLSGTAPDHLQVIDGRIIMLTDNGQFVRVHSLETGLVLRWKSNDDSGRSNPAALPTGASEWNVKLRVVGPHLYVVGPMSVISFNLDQPGDTWSQGIESDMANPRIFNEMTIDRSYVVLVDRLNNTLNTRRFYAWGRYPISAQKSFETGRLDYVQDISDPAGIPFTQGVDDGLIYLSGDQKLHFMKTQQ